jgi:hypothetical protein
MISKTLCRAQNYVGLGLYGDGATNNPAPLRTGDANFTSGNLHVGIAGTSATVIIYGRVKPLCPWVALATVSASSITQITVLAEMYAAVTAINAAAVDVALNYPNS